MFLLLGLAVADAFFYNDTNIETIRANATFNLNLTINGFSIGTAMSSLPFASSSVVFQFTNIRLGFKHYDTLTSPPTDDVSSGFSQDVFFDLSTYCQAQNWTAPGVIGNTFALAQWSEDNDYYYYYLNYFGDGQQDLDTMSWAELPAPTLSFDVNVYTTNFSDTSCPSSPTGAMSSSFSIDLCGWNDAGDCTFTIGDLGDGWLYFGGTGNDTTTSNFGFQLTPSWSITGSQVDMIVDREQTYYVPATTASFGGTSPQFPYQEFTTFTINEDGNAVITVVDGVPQRGLYAFWFTFGPVAEIAFDFTNSLSIPAGVTTYNVTMTNLLGQTIPFSDDTITAANALFIEVANVPADWYYTGITFTPSSDSMWLTANLQLVQSSTTPPTTTSQTPVPTPSFCPSSGCPHGVCQGASKACKCLDSYVPSTTLGCVANVTMAPTKSTAATVSAVNVKMNVTATRTLVPGHTTLGTKSSSKAPAGGVTTTTVAPGAPGKTTVHATATTTVLQFAAIVVALLALMF